MINHSNKLLIRKDLVELEKSGELKRIYIGAQQLENVAIEHFQNS